MKKVIKRLGSDKILRLSTLLSCGLLFLQAVFIAIIYRFLPPYIPLYNQLPWGDQRLGHHYEIILPFLIALSVLFVNIAIIMHVYDKTPLIARMLTITTLLICLISLIFVVRTSLLVI